MIKELLNNTVRVGLSTIELTDLPEASEQEEVTISYSDSLSWKKMSEALRVEFHRTVEFQPSCNFKLQVTFFVEHFLNTPNSLNQISDADIEKEVMSDPEFFIQQNQGFVARISLLISQILSSFGGTPVISPPILQLSEEC